MFESLQAQVTGIIALAVCALAVWKGDRAVRLAGAGAAITWVASAAAQDWPRAEGPEYGILAVDVVYLVFSLWLAAVSGRLWAMFIAAFQLLIVFTHISVIIDARLGAYAFFSAYFVWSYLIIVAIAIGTIQAIGRRSREAPPRRA